MMNKIPRLLFIHPAYQAINFYPILAKISGGIQSGLFLSILLDLYIDNEYHENIWINKTMNEWMIETTMSHDQVFRARKNLKELDLTEEALRGNPPALFYRPKIKNILQAIDNENKNTLTV
jgi:hypothetical protein